MDAETTTLYRVRFRCPECGEELTGYSCCEVNPHTITATCYACDPYGELIVEEYGDLIDAGLMIEVGLDDREVRIIGDH